MTNIGIILGLLTVMFLTFSMHMLWSRYEALLVEIEGLRNRLTITTARSLMCRDKLEVVTNAVDMLYVSKFSDDQEVVQ